MLHPDYKIAAGYNNAAGLVSIESITATGDTRKYYAPESLGSFSPGVRESRQDALDYISGAGGYLEWTFRLLTRNQLSYLMTTYCSGGTSGKVTIRTRTTGENYANYNAVMHVPDPSELGITNQRQRKWLDVTISFSRVVAI